MDKIIKTLLGKLQNLSLDGFIIPSCDEFQNEYVPDHLNRLKFFTGFTGSNGVAIITKNKSVFFTDGRYLNQASNQLSKDYQILDMYEKKSCDIYGELFKAKSKIGYDGRVISKKDFDYYQKLADKHDFKLVSVHENPIDEMWHESRPAPNNAFIFRMQDSFNGESTESKIERVLEKMLELKADCYFVAKPECVCWLLNIRGSDISIMP